MTPDEFNRLPPVIRNELMKDTVPRALNTKIRPTTKEPYTKAGAASLLGEAYDPYMGVNELGTTYREAADDPTSRSFITYNPNDPTAAITRAHEMEHALAAQGRGAGHNLNPMWDEMVGKEGARRGEIVNRLIKHASYLQEKYGLPEVDVKAGYFSNRVLKRPDRHNFLYEQMATLSALEQNANKRLVEDPYVREHILKTPAERETYEALTGLRQTRLDAKDLPPYTRQPGSTEPKTAQDSAGFMAKLKKLFGYANGGIVDAAGNKRVI